jgi:hypothetical protein
MESKQGWVGLVLCKRSEQIQPGTIRMDWKLYREAKKKKKRLGLGMDLVSSDPSETGRAYRRVGMDLRLRPAPLQVAAGGWTDEPRRRLGEGGRGRVKCCSVQVRGKRGRRPRVLLSGDGVHVRSVGPTMPRGPWAVAVDKSGLAYLPFYFYIFLLIYYSSSSIHPYSNLR